MDMSKEVARSTSLMIELSAPVIISIFGRFDDGVPFNPIGGLLTTGVGT